MLDEVVADKMTGQSKRSVLQLDPHQRIHSKKDIQPSSKDHETNTERYHASLKKVHKRTETWGGEKCQSFWVHTVITFSWKSNAYVSSLFFKYVPFLHPGMQTRWEYPSASGVCMVLSKHTSCFMYSVVTVWFCTSISWASQEAFCWAVGLVSPGDTSGALQEIQRGLPGLTHPPWSMERAPAADQLFWEQGTSKLWGDVLCRVWRSVCSPMGNVSSQVSLPDRVGRLLGEFSKLGPIVLREPMGSDQMVLHVACELGRVFGANVQTVFIFFFSSFFSVEFHPLFKVLLSCWTTLATTLAQGIQCSQALGK